MSLIVKRLGSALLAECNLIVERGEAVALRGPSGSGKTLLLRAIADLDPNEGEVWLGETERSSMTGPEWRRRVRFVAAEAAWWADEVGAHFKSPHEMGPMSVGLGLPADCMGWQVARLSTGEKQRLGFLRAIEDRPPVLLLDEPTAALDAEAEQAVEKAIKQLLATGTIVVFVTHSEAQAQRLAERRFAMDAGRLREE